MLFLKRFATSLVLFITLFVFLEIAAIIGVGVIVGSRAGANAADFRSAYAAGDAAGSEASRKYGRLTLLVRWEPLPCLHLPFLSAAFCHGVARSPHTAASTWCLTNG